MFRGLGPTTLNSIASPDGTAYATAGNSAGWQLSSGPLPNGSDELSIIVWGYNGENVNVSAETTLLTAGAAGSGAASGLQVATYAGGAPRAFVYYYPNYNGSALVNSPAPLSPNSPHVVGMRFVRNSMLELWVDGDMVASTAASNFAAGLRATGSGINVSVGSQARSLAIAGGAMWLRDIGPDAMRLLTASPQAPWQLFDNQRIWAPASAGAGASTITLSASLGAVVQRALSASAGSSAAVQAAGASTSSVGLAVQAARSGQAQLEAAVQAAGVAVSSLQAAVQVSGQQSASLDAALQLARSAAAALDLAVQAQGAQTASLSAQVQADQSVATGLSTYVQAGISAQVALSAAVLHQALAAAGIDTAVQLPGQTAITGVGAALQQAGAAAAAIELAVSQARSAGAALDVQVQGGSMAFGAVDAALQALATASAGITTAVAEVGSAQASLNAAVAMRASVQAALQAATQDMRQLWAALSLYIADGLVVIVAAPLRLRFSFAARHITFKWSA